MNGYRRFSAQHLVYFSIVLPLILQGCTPYRLISPPESLFQDTNVIATSGATSSSSPGTYVYGAFNRALQKAQADDAKPDDFKKLYLQGMGLVDYVCANYFRTLGKASQDMGFTRKETSLTGGVVSAMLGLANQTPKVIANTGALFGFTTASMDSYQDAYLFSPDVGAVQELVFNGFSEFRTRHPSAETWGDVVSLLPQYEEKCQPHGIRRMINASITKKPDSPPNPAPGGK